MEHPLNCSVKLVCENSPRSSHQTLFVQTLNILKTGLEFILYFCWQCRIHPTARGTAETVKSSPLKPPQERWSGSSRLHSIDSGFIAARNLIRPQLTHYATARSRAPLSSRPTEDPISSGVRVHRAFRGRSNSTTLGWVQPTLGRRYGGRSTGREVGWVHHGDLSGFTLLPASFSVVGSGPIEPAQYIMRNTDKRRVSK